MNITNPLIKLASLAFKSRKMKIILFGAQAAYMGYKFLKNKKKSTSVSRKSAVSPLGKVDHRLYR